METECDVYKITMENLVCEACGSALSIGKFTSVIGEPKEWWLGCMNCYITPLVHHADMNLVMIKYLELKGKNKVIDYNEHVVVTLYRWKLIEDKQDHYPYYHFGWDGMQLFNLYGGKQ